jgi:CBS domain-containing protein
MAITLAKSLRTDRVSRLTLRDVFSVDQATPIESAVTGMAERGTGCVLVTKDGSLVGIFTERDFLDRVAARSLDVSLPVSHVMTPSPKTVTKTDTVHVAIELMATGGYRRLPVLGKDGRPVGVLSVKDVVHYLVEYFPARVYNLPPSTGQEQAAREGA